MVIHKGVALVSYFVCVLFIAAILQRVAPKRALAGTLLFAWNPLILLEGVANGHNDLLMLRDPAHRDALREVMARSAAHSQ